MDDLTIPHDGDHDGLMITTKEAAKLLGILPQSLRVRNMRGVGPFPAMYGNGVPNFYRKKDILTELELLTNEKNAS